MAEGEGERNRAEQNRRKEEQGPQGIEAERVLHSATLVLFSFFFFLEPFVYGTLSVVVRSDFVCPTPRSLI